MEKRMDGNQDRTHAPFPRFRPRGASSEERRLRLLGQLGAFAVLFAVLGVLVASNPGTPQVEYSAAPARMLSVDDNDAANAQVNPSL